MIKVAITDDHKLFREGVRFLLDQMEGIELVFEASNGKDLLSKLETTEADVLLLDLDMPDMDGIEALRILRPQYPDLGVIILTVCNDTKMIAYLMELGANAYLLKDTDPDTLYRAIKSVYREGHYSGVNLSEGTLVKDKGQERKKPVLKTDVSLSPRELEVLELICQENTAKSAVDDHHLGHDTVERHRKLLLSKFRAHLSGTKPDKS